jgi:polyisoprenoid-binding protein YceI
MPVEVLGVGVNPMNQAPVAGFAAELVIKRSDYGVDTWVDKAGVLGDEVKVTLAIEAGAQPAK